jgi:hypothetical protein
MPSKTRWRFSMASRSVCCKLRADSLPGEARRADLFSNRRGRD